MTVDDDAIRIDGERTKSMVVPWKDVRMAYEFSSSFAVTLARGTILSIPRRAFDDDGVAFWDDLRAHLTATRYLVAPAPITGRSITNTRLRTTG